MSQISAKGWAKLLAPVLASIAGLVALRLLGPDIIDQKTLSGWIEPFGRKAPLAFVVFLSLRPFTFLPGQLFTAVGGILFGSLMASVYAMIGSFFAMSLVFFVSNRFGKKLMRRWTKGRYEAIKRAAKSHDFKFALLATINPLLPTDVAIACAAASGARFWPTVGGAMLATLPGTYVTAMFGSALSQGRTVTTVLAASGMVISLVLGFFLGRRVWQEIQNGSPCPDATEPPASTADRRLAVPAPAFSVEQSSTGA